jgi:hypothetical protein
MLILVRSSCGTWRRASCDESDDRTLCAVPRRRSSVGAVPIRQGVAPAGSREKSEKSVSRNRRNRCQFIFPSSEKSVSVHFSVGEKSVSVHFSAAAPSGGRCLEKSVSVHFSAAAPSGGRCLGGRPRRFGANGTPSCCPTCLAHDSLPNGRPLVTERRNAANSRSVSGLCTQRRQYACRAGSVAPAPTTLAPRLAARPFGLGRAPHNWSTGSPSSPLPSRPARGSPPRSAARSAGARRSERRGS